MKTLKSFATILGKSSIGNINLYWLLWTLLVFSVTLLMENIYDLLLSFNLPIGFSVSQFFILILINWVFYKGMKLPRNFKRNSVNYQTETNKIQNNNFEIDDRTEKELKEIINYIDQEMPYTDMNFSLVQLAEDLQLSRRRVSQLINNYFNKNFMTFINEYRIDLAKKRLMNPIDPKETILEIMYDVGFNSKSSFNTLFKKETGLTPKEYKSKYCYNIPEN